MCRPSVQQPPMLFVVPVKGVLVSRLLSHALHMLTLLVENARSVLMTYGYEIIAEKQSMFTKKL